MGNLSMYEKSYIHGQIMNAGAVNAKFAIGRVSAQFIARMIETGRMVEVEGGIGQLEGTTVKAWAFTATGVDWAYTCGLLDAGEIAEAKATDANFGKPVQVAEQSVEANFDINEAIYTALDSAVKAAKSQSSNDLSFRSHMSKSGARLWTLMYPEIYAKVLNANSIRLV